jgi:hypothetical protein
MESFSYESADVLQAEVRQPDLMNWRCGLAKLCQCAHQRVGEADFIVSESADEEEMPHLIMGDQILEELERRCVQPLEVIQEERERVLGSRKHR